MFLIQTYKTFKGFIDVAAVDRAVRSQDIFGFISKKLWRATPSEKVIRKQLFVFEYGK